MIAVVPSLSLPVPRWLVIALNEVGVKEIAGAGTHPRISQYMQTVRLPASEPDETPWCSAFVNWCISQAGQQGTDSAAAKSWMGWGQKLTVPTLGCIAVLWRDSPQSPNGHVGFRIRSEGGTIWLLGGNEDDQVMIKPYPVARVLCYRGMP